MGLQVQLGDAYLNLGDTDKALRQFDVALQTQATPPIWNNIAYHLAGKKFALDRAQQYAESAVGATAARLRNMNLGTNRRQQESLVASLAGYWDTLGWVHFQKGDGEGGRKYLQAAWALTQSAEVADHLGQLYEKQGDREKAARAYALGLAAKRPGPETRGRLAALVGDANVEAAVEKARTELAEQRTLPLATRGHEAGSAEFYVAMADAAAVQDVQFISGDEQLKSAADDVRRAPYAFTFPDSTPARIVRHVVVKCAGQGCSLELLPADAETIARSTHTASEEEPK
jgi:tetratricopeptide (TPR) repeat protein